MAALLGQWGVEVYAGLNGLRSHLVLPLVLRLRNAKLVHDGRSPDLGVAIVAALEL